MSKAKEHSPQSILAKLDISTLNKMCLILDKFYEMETSKKIAIFSIVQHVETVGIRQFVNIMKVAHLQDICMHLRLPISMGRANPNRNVVLRTFLELCTTNDRGLDELIARFTTDDLLCCLMCTSVNPAVSKSDQARQLADELRRMGFEVFLSSIGEHLLGSICNQLGWNAEELAASQMVEAITKGKVPPKRMSSRSSQKIFSKTKKALKKGIEITYDDIFQHYYLEELQDFCKENDLKTYGRKKDVINRILEYLEEEEEVSSDEKPVKKKAHEPVTGRKRKAEKAAVHKERRSRRRRISDIHNK